MDFRLVDWPNVLLRFGLPPQCLTPKAGPCPLPNCRLASGSSKGAGSGKPTNVDRFRFDNRKKVGDWYCQNCGAGNGLTLLRAFTGEPDSEIFKRIEKFNGMPCQSTDTIVRQKVEMEISEEQATKNRLVLVKAWGRSKAVRAFDPVGRYLENRVPGCDLRKLTDDLHFHASMAYSEWNENGELKTIGYHPTMLARARDGEGHPITLHRTYLTAGGAKANVAVAKKQMSGVRKLHGAAVRLVTVPGSRVLGVCEGIETGWSIATAYRYGINVWSLLNAGNLAVADIPKGQFDRVIIFADHDQLDVTKGYRPGLHFAKLLQDKLNQSEIPNELRLPDEEGSDFCDIWLRHYNKHSQRAA